MQEANSVGLSENYAKLVRDGTIDIETITDEDLKDKIDEYQQWYEKAIECKDAIDELNKTVSDLYKQRFDNVSTEFDGYLSIIEHEKNMLDEFVNQTETKGWLVSAKYYKALQKNELEKIDNLAKEKESLLASLSDAVNNGNIEVGSEEW